MFSDFVYSAYDKMFKGSANLKKWWLLTVASDAGELFVGTAGAYVAIAASKWVWTNKIASYNNPRYAHIYNKDLIVRPVKYLATAAIESIGYTVSTEWCMKFAGCVGAFKSAASDFTEKVVQDTITRIVVKAIGPNSHMTNMLMCTMAGMLVSKKVDDFIDHKFIGYKIQDKTENSYIVSMSYKFLSLVGENAAKNLVSTQQHRRTIKNVFLGKIDKDAIKNLFFKKEDSSNLFAVSMGLIANALTKYYVGKLSCLVFGSKEKLLKIDNNYLLDDSYDMGLVVYSSASKKDNYGFLEKILNFLGKVVALGKTTVDKLINVINNVVKRLINNLFSKKSAWTPPVNKPKPLLLTWKSKSEKPLLLGWKKEPKPLLLGWKKEELSKVDNNTLVPRNYCRVIKKRRLYV